MKKLMNKKLSKAITLFSIISTLLFVLFNAVTGILHKTSWNLAISVYYFLLLLLKVLLTFSSNKFENDDKKIRTAYIFSFAFLLLLNISLIGPAIILVRNSKMIHADKISSIAVATFVFSRLVISIIGLKKGVLKDDLLQKQLKIVSFVSSIVSLIVLENTLINVHGSMDGGIYILSFTTTFGLLLTLLIVIVFSFIKNLELTWKMHDN